MTNAMAWGPSPRLNGSQLPCASYLRKEARKLTVRFTIQALVIFHKCDARSK